MRFGASQQENAVRLRDRGAPFAFTSSAYFFTSASLTLSLNTTMYPGCEENEWKLLVGSTPYQDARMTQSVDHLLPDMMWFVRLVVVVGV